MSIDNVYRVIHRVWRARCLYTWISVWIYACSSGSDFPNFTPYRTFRVRVSSCFLRQPVDGKSVHDNVRGGTRVTKFEPSARTYSRTWDDRKCSPPSSSSYYGSLIGVGMSSDDKYVFTVPARTQHFGVQREVNTITDTTMDCPISQWYPENLFCSLRGV